MVSLFYELTNMAILTEEVGTCTDYGESMATNHLKSDENVNLADEMADVLWVLLLRLIKRQI